MPSRSPCPEVAEARGRERSEATRPRARPGSLRVQGALVIHVVRHNNNKSVLGQLPVKNKGTSEKLGPGSFVHALYRVQDLRRVPKDAIFDILTIQNSATPTLGPVQ